MTEKEQNAFKTREIKIEQFCSGVVVYFLGPSTRETEAGWALWVWDQPGLFKEIQSHQELQGEPLSRKQNRTQQNKQPLKKKTKNKGFTIETAKWFTM